MGRRSSPDTQLSKVVLPQPDGPSKAAPPSRNVNFSGSSA